jgi:hypothetical protein
MYDGTKYYRHEYDKYVLGRTHVRCGVGNVQRTPLLDN